MGQILRKRRQVPSKPPSARVGDFIFGSDCGKSFQSCRSCGRNASRKRVHLLCQLYLFQGQCDTADRQAGKKNEYDLWTLWLSHYSQTSTATQTLSGVSMVVCFSPLKHLPRLTTRLNEWRRRRRETRSHAFSVKPACSYLQALPSTMCACVLLSLAEIKLQKFPQSLDVERLNCSRKQ